MSIKAVVFDIGQTLVYYPFPLNWSALYRPAFEHVEKQNGLRLSEEEYAHILNVLAKYNTRIHPREKEVSSDQIFSEILEGTSIPKERMQSVKEDFYGFFRGEARIYPEAEETLKELVFRGILTATLSDVPYGMDNRFALEDIAPLIPYITFPCTSNDTGYRKPSREGLQVLSEKMGVTPSEIVFVGDEKKDIECAKSAGAVAVLINRTDTPKDYGQDDTIGSLDEIFDILK